MTMCRNTHFRRLTRRVLPCLAGVALLGLAADSNAAHWFKASATMCTPDSGLSGANFTNDLFTESGPLSHSHLTCPLYEREGLERINIDVLDVHLRDGSPTDNVAVQLCRRLYTGAGASCGAASSTGNGYVGNVHYRLSDLHSEAWFFSEGFAYLAIDLSDQSEFRGYRIKNN